MSRHVRNPNTGTCGQLNVKLIQGPFLNDLILHLFCARRSTDLLTNGHLADIT